MTGVRKIPDASGRVVINSLLFFSAYTIFLCIFAVLQGPSLDYPAYERQWAAVLDGGDPWRGGIEGGRNAYGPLHNLFAPLWWVWSSLPKVVFGSLVGLGAYVLARPLTSGGSLSVTMATCLFMMVFPLNSVILHTAFNISSNDAVCVGLVALAIASRAAGKHCTGGVLLGLAALMKFYPILLVPFFALDEHRTLRVRGALVAFATFVLGMAMAVVIWGESALSPIACGAERSGGRFGIYGFMNAFPDLFGGTEVVAFLDDMNAYIVLTSVLLVFALSVWKGIHWAVASAVAYLAIVSLYKLGHGQFWALFFVLYAALFTFTPDKQTFRALWTLAPVAVLLSTIGVLVLKRKVDFGLGSNTAAQYFGLPLFLFALFAVVLTLCDQEMSSRNRVRLIW